MKGTHSHKLSFEVFETNNPKTLVFIDSSEYFQEPDRPLLEITLPGYDKYLLVNVVARNVNTFNSSTIGLNKVLKVNQLSELPDGTWKFRYKICPYNLIYVDKKVYRTTAINNKLKKLYENLDLQDAYIKSNTDLHRDLSYIHILIKGAQTVVENDMRKAYDNYQLADKLIDKALKKFCKNCR